MAKEQGLRSRAAFKLSQINRKFSIFETLLQNSNSQNNNNAVILDLCAAPGGWTQIVARSLPKIPIIAVDILPIRAFTGHRNVTTLIGDITTDQCQANITRTIKSIVAESAMNQGNKKKSNSSPSSATCSLVLHDGAPNVGADYAKDAYVQNEIALSALKCATQHLCVGGTFITKVYRSRDYAAYHWTISQLFMTVTAFKPTASRNTSAEIFLVAQNYKAPQKLDSKFLDPKHVFASIDDDPNNQNKDSNASATTATTVGNSKTIFDKNWDKHVRQRGGYDMDHYDATMRHIEPVSQFISSSTSMKDAIQLLSTCTGLSFHCAICRPQQQELQQPGSNQCYCQFILHHPFTTMEMKEHCSDLRVLNKSDFKAMFHWRTKMQQAITAQKELSKDDDDEDEEDDDEKANYDSDTAPSKIGKQKNLAGDNKDDDEEDEEMIAKEIEEVRLRRQRERKRLKKKEHEKMQKRRKKAALSGNMINMDISNGMQDSIFSLASIPNAKALDAIREVNIDQVTDEDLMINHDATADDDMVVIGRINEENSNSDEDDDSVVKRERLIQRERDLEEGYIQYLQTTKNKNNVEGTKLAKRSKKLMRDKVVNEIQEDTEMAQIDNTSYDAKVYAKMLQGKDDSDDDDDDDNSDSDDGYDAEPMTPSEFQASMIHKTNLTGSGKSDNQNPLLHQFDINESQSMKTARWFSNPLFAAIGQSVSTTTTISAKGATAKATSKANTEIDSDDDYDGDDNQVALKQKERRQSRDNDNSKKRKAVTKKVDEDDVSNDKLSPEDIIASMPKTDKQIRHEKRLKLMERDERKKLKRAQKSGDTENEFQLVANTSKNGNNNSDSENEDNPHSRASKQNLDHLSEAQKARVLEARKLIKAGLGQASGSTTTETSKMKENDKIELVPQDATVDRPLPIMDDRKYDSENEDYDSDDHAKTLALGTMMLRRSKEKALVDSSYNRYAWNDPSDLPEWFVDDENKHYRPQLPIPPALLAKMKEKMMALSAKPIAKVAEARARKSRRAKMKLAAAKKQAEAVANSNDMSEAMKLKAISKALTSGKNDSSNKKGGGKKYVVAKKGRGNIGGVKGAKVVDKLMKKEKRATDRIVKTKKKGKQNGLSGSKKRRNHK